MPPWHLDKTVGIRRYKNDISLTDREIDTIAKWVDAGAPEGDAADMPKMLTFASEDEWFIGKPDLLVTTSDFHHVFQRSRLVYRSIRGNDAHGRSVDQSDGDQADQSQDRSPCCCARDAAES